MSHKILLLEDDELFCETLEDFLEEEGFDVDLAHEGREALQKSYNNVYDLYLLDVKVPHINGFDFLKMLRDAGNDTPAIFITSLKEMQDLSKGFLVGADDYLKKPFELEELLLRINAVLRRKGIVDLFEIDSDFTLDIKRKRLYKNSKEIPLNLKDIQLLILLVQNRGKVVTKEMILDTLWSSEENASYGSIRVYINNLKKIFSKEKIVNIRGIGYKFEKLAKAYFYKSDISFYPLVFYLFVSYLLSFITGISSKYLFCLFSCCGFFRHGRICYHSFCSQTYV